MSSYNIDFHLKPLSPGLIKGERSSTYFNYPWRKHNFVLSFIDTLNLDITFQIRQFGTDYS